MIIKSGCLYSISTAVSSFHTDASVALPTIVASSSRIVRYVSSIARIQSLGSVIQHGHRILAASTVREENLR